MRIAVLGGSFNPLHCGHAMLADTVIKELNYDKVIFVPTNNPPHKRISSGLSANQRYNLVKYFCEKEGTSHFEVEDCELKRGGVSYTSDTISFLNEKYKSVLSEKIGLIMGGEIASEFEKWHESKWISENVNFIIVPRVNSDSVDNKTCKNLPINHYKGDFNVPFDEKKFGYKCTILSSKIISVSSTDIRNRISDGRSFRYLVPDSVFEYIVKNELY